MRVLFTTPVLEHPPAGGPRLRIENSIKALSRVCELTVVSRVQKAAMGGEAAERFYREVCSGFYYAPSVEEARGLAGRLLNRFRRLTGYDPDVRFILGLVSELRIDVVWFGYGNISYPLISEIKRKRPALKVVCDTDSVWSRFVLRELPYESDPVRRADIERRGMEKEAEERAWVNLCDVTTAVSELDADYYRDIAEIPEKVMVFSNVIDLKAYEEVPDVPPSLKKPCIYLAGSFWAKSPMEQAARWLLSEVMPRLRKRVPGLHCYIIGNGSKETLVDVADPDVTVLGKVESVLPYLCHASVALVPLMFESGTRFKILEAAACSVPVVSTVLGAEGLPVRDGREVLLADDAAAFAEAIARLIEDRGFASGIASNCRRLIAEKYSVEYHAEEARAILERLAR